MDDSAPTDIAASLLRVSLGIMFIAHSVLLKFFTFGLNGAAGYFQSLGLPGWFVYPIFAAEAIGGVLLVLGVQARWVALALIPVLIGTIVFEHGRRGWLFAAPGGGWEYPLFLIIVSIAVFLLGDGAFALRPSKRSVA